MSMCFNANLSCKESRVREFEQQESDKGLPSSKESVPPSRAGPPSCGRSPSPVISYSPLVDCHVNILNDPTACYGKLW